MEIEEDREYGIRFVRSWVEKVRELRSKWILEGRSKSAGYELEFQAGHLGTCLDVVWEEVQEEEGEKKAVLSREISLYMAEMKFLTWFAGSYRKDTDDEPRSFQESAFGSCEEESSDIAEDLPKDAVVQEVEVEFDLGKESRDGRSVAKTSEDYSDQGVEAKDEEELEFVGDTTKLKVEDAFLSDGQIGKERDYIVTDPNLLREELARDFEKTMFMAALELQTEKAAWIVGMQGQPVFLLVMEEEEFGSKAEQDPDLLGPPPRNSCSPESVRPIFHQAKSNIIEIGSWLEIKGPFQWPNCLIERPEFGPQLHGLHPISIIKRANTLQPPECVSTLRRTKRSQERSCVPPSLPLGKPPPRPPDLPPKPSRLEINPSISVPGTWCPSSLGVNGKFDAAGDDPGDLQFSLPLALASTSKYSLEVKAIFKGLARVLTKEGSHVAPPPAEPPPQPPIDYGSTLIVDTWVGLKSRLCLKPRRLLVGSLRILRGIHNGGMRTPKSIDMINHSPRPPEHANREVEPQDCLKQFSWLMKRLHQDKCSEMLMGVLKSILKQASSDFSNPALRTRLV